MQGAFSCLSLIALFALAHGQYQVPGPCPKVNGIDKLNLNRFIGSFWHEHTGYSNPVFRERTNNTMQYKDFGGNDLWVTISSKHKEYHDVFSRKVNYVGKGNFQFEQPAIDIFISTHYRIIGIDYINYAIAYDCIEVNKNHDMNLVILTTSPNPSPFVLQSAKDKIKSLGLPLSPLYEIDSQHPPH